METLFSVQGRMVNKSEKAPLSLLCESFPSQGFLFVLGCSSSLPFALASPPRHDFHSSTVEWVEGGLQSLWCWKNGYEARNDSWICKLSCRVEPVLMQQVATSSKPSPVHVCVFPFHFPPSISSRFFMIISPLPSFLLECCFHGFKGTETRNAISSTGSFLLLLFSFETGSLSTELWLS